MSPSRALALVTVMIMVGPGLQAAAQPPEKPDPQVLMTMTIQSPPSYRGVRSVVVWSADGARAMEYGETREGNRVRLEVRPTVEVGPAILLGSPAEWRVYQPQVRRLEKTEMPERILQRRMAQAFQSYGWQVVGSDEVAGRAVWIVQAAANYAGGYRNVFYVDREHPVVLRREKYDSRERLVYRSTFTEIEFEHEDIDDGVFENPGPNPTPAMPPPIAEAGSAMFQPRLPESALPGFVSENSDGLSRAVAGTAGHHTLYSDGLECVSLFQFSGNRPVELGEPTEEETIDGHSARRSQGAEGNMLTWTDGERSYLLVTALPCETVEPVVRQLAPPTPESPGLMGYMRRGWNRLMRMVGLAG